MRLIDADALKGAINKATDVVKGKGYDELTHIFDGIIDLVDRMPTADAVPVVRCKDCEWYDAKECIEWRGLNIAKDEQYCSYGERRKDAEVH